MTKRKPDRAAANKNKFTPAFAAGYKTSPESPFLFRLFYKNIFRMPSFNDLYYTYNTNTNPKLLPEYSSQFDAGLTYTRNLANAGSRINISMDVYYNQIKDKIIAVPAQNLIYMDNEKHRKGPDLGYGFKRGSQRKNLSLCEMVGKICLYLATGAGCYRSHCSAI